MRLDDFVLYLDENICNCRPILEALEERNIRHESHLSYWPRGTPDAKWLPEVGKKGWILLTRDQHIRYNALEHKQVVRAKVREFVITGGNLNKYELAQVLIKAIPAMRNLCAKQEPPFIATISKAGTVTLKFDKLGPLHKRKKRKG